MTKRGLGKGIESIIPNQVIEAEYDPTAESDNRLSRTKNVLISDIKPNPNQPRRKFDDKSLNELAQSIREHGVLQPIVVVATDDDGYMIVAGERRWRASKQIGLEKIPAIIRTYDAQAQLETALIENIQREDLNPLELATVLFKLAEQFNMTQQQIAKRVSKSPSAVANTMRLLGLPNPAKQALIDGRIVEGHARQILAIGEPKKQQELLDLILRYGWTVRRAEQYVTAYKEGALSQQAALKNVRSETPLTKQISKRLKTKVTLHKMAKGGRLIIEYKSDKDLERIAKVFKS